ncbi:acetylornithine deacetylase [Actibacterium pelagium]|uniref:Acetylornithine deacetylase n=1 Tax=Actibacterium pelagium TaxID=2029103 RepID=A0A917EIK6_9RHOB|nr:acetylornithine deacetylase [Actibacterium pelagium]GGE47081.1 acetylornithine deacetylase [Actibacterium pelagium]
MARTLSPRELLEKLVSFPTVSRDSNLPLVDWLEEYLRSQGVAPVRMDSPCGKKAALYAHVGPEIEGAIVLSGHTDVVPVDGQPWNTDPFEVVEKDGKLYGRGTCDMKGYDALAIWALVEAHKMDLERPLQLALSYDEELGCIGAPALIEHMLSHGMPRGATVLVGEPSMMKVVTGHKGMGGFSVHIRGHEVHSSLLPYGVSATMEAGRLIQWANEQNEANAGKVSDLAAPFDPPFTTLHMGVVNGGTASNITALDCRFTFDYRIVPGETTAQWADAFVAEVDKIHARISAIQPDAGVNLVPKFDIPALVPEQNGEAEAIARALTGDNANHVVSYATEAGQFQEAGYSAVVCGPGNIEQAHQPNEYISIAQFEAGQAYMQALLATLQRQG